MKTKSEILNEIQTEAPSCELICVHPGEIEKIRGKMPDDDTLIDLAELFKVFGDSTRIKILSALSGGELCVCDLSVAVGMSSSAVSHQLKILKNAELVRFRRDGKVVFYSLADDHVNTILRQGLEHVNE
ncbi:MAG: helix-turn-helix transcriptional regulator [Oscillospiraceae bacterium]|nr:helix-turn-helix transcriptional regulator [Oscillospiraceae bacterium]